VDDGIALEFYGMDTSDHWFTREVVGCMRNQEKVNAHLGEPTEKGLVEAITRSSHVITLRFHGMVFSALLGRPFTCVAHHDKLWDFCADHKLASVTDYYGLSQDAFYKAQGLEPSLSQLREIVATEKERWASLAPRVAEKLAL
jgi:polysaccharide pyruvyl transferase WcaK-like protein